MCHPENVLSQKSGALQRKPRIVHYTSPLVSKPWFENPFGTRELFHGYIEKETVMATFYMLMLL
jgi:hypothetical protein